MARISNGIKVRVEFKTGKDELSRKLTGACLEILRNRATKDNKSVTEKEGANLWKEI